MTGRAEELAARLAHVHDRIAAAAAAANRAPDEITLVAVTKYFPASDVRILHDLGVRHVGESRHQEAAAKREACAGLDLSWHFVGRLQSNKAAAVAQYADVVESVDRQRLLAPLAAGAARRGREIDVLVQVGLDPEAPPESGRGGVPLDRAGELAAAVVSTEGLRLRGVMAVAPRGADPRDGFELLARAARLVRSVESRATWVSAGMSGDLEQAVIGGATHVRVGTAILGNRPERG